MPGDLAALGPFFAVGTHPPGAAPPAPWLPAAELTVPSRSLRQRIASVRATLAARGGVTVAEIEPRVAASAAHLGLAARLTAPALGAAVLRCPLDLRPGALWWQDVLGGPVPLSVPASDSEGGDRIPAAGSVPLPAVRGASPGQGADVPVNSPARAPDVPGPPFHPQGRPGQEPGSLGEWDQVLVDELLAPLTAAVAELVPVSGRVLRGNVASAVNAAAAQVARQRPDLAAAAWQAAARLLGRPWLREERNPPGPAFRRSSCCLFYRLGPGKPSGICGDCIFAG